MWGDNGRDGRGRSQTAVLSQPPTTMTRGAVPYTAPLVIVVVHVRLLDGELSDHARMDLAYVLVGAGFRELERIGFAVHRRAVYHRIAHADDVVGHLPAVVDPHHGVTDLDRQRGRRCKASD